MITEFLDYVKEKWYGKEPSLEEKIEQSKTCLNDMESQFKTSIERAETYKQKMLELAEQSYKTGNLELSKRCCTFAARNELQLNDYNKRMNSIKFLYIIVEHGDLDPDALIHPKIHGGCYFPTDNKFEIRELSDSIYRTMEAKLKTSLKDAETKYVR